MAPKTTLWKKVTDCSTDEVEDEYIASVVVTEMERLRKEFMDHLLQKDKIIDNLLQELSNLKKSIATLNKRVNDTGAYERSDCIILSGNSLPLAMDGELTTQIVCKTVKDKMNLASY